MAATQKKTRKTYHIVPGGDAKDHVITSLCWCKPDPDPGNFDVLVHHALDGRDDLDISQDEAN